LNKKRVNITFDATDWGLFIRKLWAGNLSGSRQPKGPCKSRLGGLKENVFEANGVGRGLLGLECRQGLRGQRNSI